MTKVNYKLQVELDLGRVLPHCVCVSEYGLNFLKSIDICLRSCDLIFIMERTTMHNSTFMSSMLNFPNAPMI